MPYIGTDINYGNLAKQTGTGDGADTTPIAALTYTVPSSESILVFLDGVCQVPSTDFTATGTTLTFTTAPANGVAILVMFLGRSLDIGTPADNTVGLAQLAGGTDGNLITYDASGDPANVATGTATHVLTSNGAGAAPTFQAASGGGDTRNFIIDGDFTQWPEGASATTSVNNQYSSALIKTAFSYDGTTTWERSTDVPTASTTVPEFEYSHLTKCTGTDASIASGQHMLLRYHITGSDFKYLHKKQVTFSWWAKTAAANSGDTVSVGLNNSAYNRGYVFTFAPTSTWTKFTETITMDASGTWLFTEADLGLSIVFVLAVGSTYHASSDDTWEGSNVWGSSSTSNFMDSTSNEFYITGLSVVLGSSAPSTFLGESISTVKDRTNYYVQKFGGDIQYQRFAMGLLTSTTQGYYSIRFYKDMRRIPDMSEGAGGWNVQSGTGYANEVTLTFAQIGKDGCRMAANSLSPTAGSFVDGDAIELYSHAAASYFLADARH